MNTSSATFDDSKIDINHNREVQIAQEGGGGTLARSLRGMLKGVDENYGDSALNYTAATPPYGSCS